MFCKVYDCRNQATDECGGRCLAHCVIHFHCTCESPSPGKECACMLCCLDSAHGHCKSRGCKYFAEVGCYGACPDHCWFEEHNFRHCRCKVPVRGDVCWCKKCCEVDTHNHCAWGGCNEPKCSFPEGGCVWHCEDTSHRDLHCFEWCRDCRERPFTHCSKRCTKTNHGHCPTKGCSSSKVCVICGSNGGCKLHCRTDVWHCHGMGKCSPVKCDVTELCLNHCEGEGHGHCSYEYCVETVLCEETTTHGNVKKYGSWCKKHCPYIMHQHCSRICCSKPTQCTRKH